MGEEADVLLGARAARVRLAAEIEIADSDIASVRRAPPEIDREALAVCSMKIDST
jgi:hypothetical protein